DLNVIEGVNKLCTTTIVQNAWANNQKLGVHGWVLDLESGYINDLKVSVTSAEHFDNVFKIA
ncbi:carbonic anhydrase, partial [Pseudoxanthomonas sp. SGD-10]